LPDNLTREQRRKTMAAVKAMNTSLERTVDQAFRKQRWTYDRNVQGLPGKPDFVFYRARLVVFVDGDFWHGWRFPQWNKALKPYWRRKIGRTRARDRTTFNRLRRQGWTVLRFWEHQVSRDLEGILDKVHRALKGHIRNGGPALRASQRR